MKKEQKTFWMIFGIIIIVVIIIWLIRAVEYRPQPQAAERDLDAWSYYLIGRAQSNQALIERLENQLFEFE